MKRKKIKHINLRTKKQNVMKPINLKVQLLVGFMIPILVVIYVGFNAYNQSSVGLVENYEMATFSSMEMAARLIDSGLKNITSAATEISSTDDFLYYTSDLENLNSARARRDVQDNILMKLVSNDMIANVHLIPNSSALALSTDAVPIITGQEIYADIRKQLEAQASAQNTVDNFGSTHSVLDEYLGHDSDIYAGTFCCCSQYSETLVIIDISKDKIIDILKQIDLGEKSILTYHTPDGNEVCVGSDSFAFTDKEYSKKAFASKETGGMTYVNENGTEYLYMYSKCATNGSMISALVPKSVITAQADDIRTNVIICILVASVLVGIIGVFILLGLQKNVKHITDGLVKAAGGDLTVDLKLQGKSEFAVLARHVMETIQNTKTLISSVQHTAQDVSASSGNVSKVSDVIHESVSAISDALEEINSGVSQEAEDAEECLVKMDNLSGKILHTNDTITKVENLADSTRQMAMKGSESMNLLMEHSRETSQITATVNDKVDRLAEHTMQIETFVKNIHDIADQTTLLSLNASIEAARANEMGRGFNVVAEEIKKLSENSMESAKAIEALVAEISIMTADTKIATQKSQSIVLSQQKMVENTKQMFFEMSNVIATLLNNMQQLNEEVQSMDADRVDTLNAIQNISGVIEETLASSCVVSERLKEQVSIMEGLSDATTQLNDNTNELDHAVGKFIL